MFRFIGGDFTAIWYFHRQYYQVYKEGAYIGTFYKFDHVRNYLGNNYIQERI